MSRLSLAPNSIHLALPKAASSGPTAHSHSHSQHGELLGSADEGAVVGFMEPHVASCPSAVADGRSTLYGDRRTWLLTMDVLNGAPLVAATLSRPLCLFQLFQPLS
ncbi:uncharacterized protein SETTUDRAFT_24419 [Exserohilum turcica Et28A]|uniref:Uncharacterized protein n=1 Tax=Exserohilum turcicum (strain 28A) TaxID=671987 RepID=R0I5R5_EXST2|nr:uncharacterized protein SETTUDRAFT_24419 [Exserohilum turcica Et28A]EOA80906.1 hypothetical protein SETTUDRAFT_24419 [Exserohilum turcica Et28A]